MRIRHVVLTRAFAGVERHVCVLANEQAHRGDSVEVWGGDPAVMRSQLIDGVQHRPAVGVLPTAMRGAWTPAPDVVHAHMTKAELASVAATAFSHAPVVVTRHFARERGASLGGRLVRSVIARQVAAQIAISRFVADGIDGLSTVVYPGVEGEDHRPDQFRRPVVLVVQRLEAEKNTDVALRGFAAGAPEDWTLEIVGHGQQEPSLRRLARDLGVEDRLSFLGFRDDVPALMRSSGMLIAPCEVEGLGLSVLEAMAHGLPVVASDAGAHRETVGQAQSAQLFAAGDFAAAGKLIKKLCSDVSLRQSYGEQLRALQQTRFTPQAQAAATEVIYQEVLT